MERGLASSLLDGEAQQKQLRILVIQDALKPAQAWLLELCRLRQ